MNYDKHIKHLTECIALATSSKPMSQIERVAHARRCAAEMARAEQRRQSDTQQQTFKEVA